MTAAIDVCGLTKRFGALTALEGISLEVASGQTVALWGANGAGKTTLLRCLLGLMPYEGVVTVMGHDVHREGTTVRRLLGYVPQELGLPGELSVREAVAFYAALRRVPWPRVQTLAEAWHLEAALGQCVRHLSGGMKQKVALVIALLDDPPILLLDEPTSHLDAQTRREFSALLEQLKRQGKTLVMCSHRPSEVLRLADRVIALERGRVAQEGSPEAMRAWLGQRVVRTEHVGAA